MALLVVIALSIAMFLNLKFTNCTRHQTLAQCLLPVSLAWCVSRGLGGLNNFAEGSLRPLGADADFVNSGSPPVSPVMILPERPARIS